MSAILLIVYPVASEKLNRPPPAPGASRKAFPVIGVADAVGAPSTVVVDRRDRREAAAADCRLWPFDRNRESELAAEVLHDAEAVLARPSEADGILRIDRQRNPFLAVVDALLIFGGQRPHLAAGEAPAAVELGLRPNLALAQNIAVALAVVGGDASAQPVRFVVAGQLCRRRICLPPTELKRLWRPVKLLSPTLESELPGKGMLLNGVLMSELVAR